MIFLGLTAADRRSLEAEMAQRRILREAGRRRRTSLLLPQPRREAQARWVWDATPELPFPPAGTMAALAEGMAALQRAFPRAFITPPTDLRP